MLYPNPESNCFILHIPHDSRNVCLRPPGRNLGTFPVHFTQYGKARKLKRNFFFLILKIDHFQQFVHFFYSANSFGKSFFFRLFLLLVARRDWSAVRVWSAAAAAVVVSKGKQASIPLVLCGLFFVSPLFFFFFFFVLRQYYCCSSSKVLRTDSCKTDLYRLRRSFVEGEFFFRKISRLLFASFDPFQSARCVGLAHFRPRV